MEENELKGLHSEFEGAGTPFFPGFFVSEFSDSRQQLAYEAPESSIYGGSGAFLFAPLSSVQGMPEYSFSSEISFSWPIGREC